MKHTIRGKGGEEKYSVFWFVMYISGLIVLSTGINQLCLFPELLPVSSHLMGNWWGGADVGSKMYMAHQLDSVGIFGRVLPSICEFVSEKLFPLNLFDRHLQGMVFAIQARIKDWREGTRRTICWGFFLWQAIIGAWMFSTATPPQASKNKKP